MKPYTNVNPKTTHWSLFVSEFSLGQNPLTSISSHLRSTTLCPAFGCHVGKVTVALERGRAMSGSRVAEVGLLCRGGVASVRSGAARLCRECSQFVPSKPSLHTQRYPSPLVLQLPWWQGLLAQGSETNWKKAYHIGQLLIVKGLFLNFKNTIKQDSFPLLYSSSEHIYEPNSSLMYLQGSKFKGLKKNTN